MAQPTFETVTLNSGSGGSSHLVETLVGGEVVFGSLIVWSSGDGTVNAVTTTEPLPVDLYAGASALSTGGGAEAGALLVTLANDSTGVLSVDDNGGALTIDHSALDNAHSADFDTGGGTDTTSAFGLAIPASGGAVAVDSNNPLPVDASGAAVPVTDNSGSLTVDNAGTFVVQEDGAALTALQLIDDPVVTLGTGTYSEATTKGNVVAAVRNDELATLADTDNEFAPLQVDAQGALYAAEYTRIDSNNSSTSTLGGGATFTGTGTDCREARNIAVTVFADQDSATGGLKVQFSSDNTNWDEEEDFTISASTGESHIVPVMAQYYRVTYTNGATPQGAFRLQSMLVPHDITGTVAQLQSTVGNSNQAVLTRAVIAAFDGTNFTNVQSTAGGNLKISLQEASDGLDIGAGNAGGETIRVSVATDDVNLSAINTATTDLPNVIGTDGSAGPSKALSIAGTESGGNLQELLVDASGHLQIDVLSAPSTAVTNAGTFAVQEDGAALTALQLIDDPVFADDAAFTEDTDKVMVGGAVRDDEVGSTQVVSTDGDAGPLRMNKFGMLKVTQMPDATSEVKRAVINASSSGDNTIVAAAGAGIKIRVLDVVCVAAGDVTARFESGAGGSALTGQMDLTANSGFAPGFCPVGHFETGDNTLLNLELDAAVRVSGWLVYVEV